MGAGMPCIVRLSCAFSRPHAPSNHMPTVADIQESDTHCEGGFCIQM